MVRLAKVKIVKERRHSQRLSSKIKFDSKTIDKLHKNIDDLCSESEAQVKAADEKFETLRECITLPSMVSRSSIMPLSGNNSSYMCR